MSSTRRGTLRIALVVGAILFGIGAVAMAVDGNYGGAIGFAGLSAAATNYGIVRPRRVNPESKHVWWVGGVVLALAIGVVGDKTGFLLTQAARDTRSQDEQEHRVASDDAANPTTAVAAAATNSPPAPIDTAPECALPTVIVESQNWHRKAKLMWHRADVTIRITNNSRLPISPLWITIYVSFRNINGVEKQEFPGDSGKNPDLPQFPEQAGRLPKLNYGESVTISQSLDNTFVTDGSQPQVGILRAWWDFAENDSLQRAQCSGEGMDTYSWNPGP